MFDECREVQPIEQVCVLSIELDKGPFLDCLINYKFVEKAPEHLFRLIFFKILILTNFSRTFLSSLRSFDQIRAIFV